MTQIPGGTMIVVMIRKCWILFPCLLLWGGPGRASDLTASLTSANPLRGNGTLVQKGCINCHSIWGVGGKLGPDLATAGTDQSFQQLASMFWNHTPRMVKLLKQKGKEWPALAEQEMADIMSFIYYLKLLDHPGDAVRGQALFQDKKCAACHSQTRGTAGRVLPLDRFSAFVSPVPLAQAMWNAGREMHRAQTEQGVSMPHFQGRDMADLQAYLRDTGSSTVSGTTYLPLPDLARGGGLFQSKGCQSCHARGGMGPDLSAKPLRKSISEICGVLWNHSFAMQTRMASRGMQFPRLNGHELSDILAYVYFLHFSSDQGDAVRGESIFREKGCAHCHSKGTDQKIAGPRLNASKEQYHMLRLATSMWNHAPIMFDTMKSEVMKWIKLDPDDMQDISKYLQGMQRDK